MEILLNCQPTSAIYSGYVTATNRGKFSLTGKQARDELSEQNLQKHALIEKIPFDVHHYLQTGEIKEMDTLLVAYYPPKQQKAYTLSVHINQLEQIEGIK